MNMLTQLKGALSGYRMLQSVVFFLMTTVSGLLIFCNRPLESRDNEVVTFGVLNVGQGLSQILQQGSHALLFDTGTDDTATSWINAWRQAGSPYIEAVIISHRDLDHAGGLLFLDKAVNWSGRLVTGKWEDTSFIRSCCRNWPGRLSISTIGQNDTIFFAENIQIVCRWPPDSPPTVLPAADSQTNEHSLVMHLRYGNTAVLLTGDIDSSVARILCDRYKAGLRADLVVVPHHGSASSVYPLLYGYVRPLNAIISCGRDNRYGHPAQETIDMLARMGINWHSTAGGESFYYRSNAFYWEAGY